MRKKILGMLLVLCMVFTMVPATVFAAEEYNVWVGGIQVTAENTSGEGWSYTPAAGETPQTLTLEDANITTWGTFVDKPYAWGMSSLFGIYAAGELNIVLIGSNSVDISSSSTTTGFNCAIFVAGDIRISGSGSLTAKGGSVNNVSNYQSCGIYSYNTSIESATVTAIAGATQTSGCGSGFYGNLTMNNGGTLIADAQASEDSSYGAYLGTCVINDGTLTATGGDAAQYSYGLRIMSSITINGGTVTASSGSVGGTGFSRAMDKAPSFGASYTPQVTAGESSTVNTLVAVPDMNTYRDNNYVKIEPGTPPVATIEETSQGYATLQEAVDGVENGQTIKLLADVDLTTPVTTRAVDFTLDLNGKTITDTASYAAINHSVAGTLTIKDSSGGGSIIGSFDISSGGARAIYVNHANANLIIDGGIITGGRFTNYDGSGGNAIQVVEGNLTVNNGTITGGSGAIGSTMNGHGIGITSGTLTVNNGTITGGSGYRYGGIGISAYAAGATVIVNNGTITGGEGTFEHGCAMLVGSNSVTLNGGTLKSGNSGRAIDPNGLDAPLREASTLLGSGKSFLSSADGTIYDTLVDPSTILEDLTQCYLQVMNTPASYTVTYDNNSGTGTMSTGTALEGIAFTMPSCTLTPPAGKQFKEWAIGSADGTKVATGGTYIFTENTTVYAVWEEEPFAGTVIISGTLKFNETLTATVSGGNNTGILSYQWKRGTTNLSTGATYTTVLADIGQTITCEVTSDAQTGAISGSTTGTIAKADGLEVVGVSATNCTTLDNNDGTLIGVTADMKYKMSGDVDWTEGTGSTITGLSNGTYKVYMKETETHNAGAERTFTIAPYSITPTYGVSLDKTDTHVFAGATVGYGEQGTCTVQVSNTGNQATGALSVALSGANSDSFTLNKTNIDSIGASGNDTFTVKPNTGLAAGVYTATVTVAKALGNGNDITAQSFDISFTVTDAFNITFDANSGTVTPTTATTSLEGKLGSLPTPTRSGSYRFDGWFTAVSGGTQVTTATVFTGDDTIYARWTYIGGGGSGGGGSSGGTSNNSVNNNASNITVTTPPAEQPNNPTQGEIKVSGKVDENKNVIISLTDKNVADVYNKALADAKKNGNEENGITLVLNVDTGNQTANRMTVNLPKAVQDAIISKKIVNTVVVVDNPDILIGMDLSAVEEINKQANTDVNLTAEKADGNQLKGAAKEAIGSRPVFVLKVNYGSGRQVENFGEGSITVEIPYTLGENEDADNIFAVYIDDNGNVEWLTDSVYDRAKKVVRFSTKHFSTYGIGYKQTNLNFTDITNHWAKESIEFAVSRGLFSGTAASTFSPDTTMTRGMFVTALGRMAEVNTKKYTKTSFTDVKNDAYYMPYIEWASKNNIVTGMGEGKFAPDQSITREQMAVIMNNYAKVMGVVLPKVHDENTFADSAKIGTWARTAVENVLRAGIISGRSGNVFDPQDMATRAEVSVVMKRFMELAGDSDTVRVSYS